MHGHPASKIRFPTTRTTLTVARPDGAFYAAETKDFRIMGEKYPYYTSPGGVECWVVKAQAKKEWLPDYYAPTIT